jgi:hypothetical protein
MCIGNGRRCTYCVHGLATGQAVPHPVRPESRITPLETSKLVKKDLESMLGNRIQTQTAPSQTASHSCRRDRPN